MKILIVDDSKINQIIAKDTLVNHQIETDILIANDGDEALNLIGKQSIDLVLLDIVMPKVTGLEVLESIREQSFDLKPEFIMLTSISDRATLLKCFELGAVDYIKKPFDDIDFIARVKSALRSIKQKNQIKSDAIKLLEKNRELQEAQFHLVQKEKLAAIGELAAGVAHEINNPLAFVMSNFSNLKSYGENFISLLSWIKEKEDFVFSDGISKKAFLDLWKEEDYDFLIEDFPDVIEESQKGLERVAKIVTSMRNFSRISEEDAFEYVDVNDLLEEVLIVVNNEVKYTAEIEKKWSDTPLLYCNKGEIEQVLVNMIINASQSIKEQKPNEMGKIIIESGVDKEYITISICDDGKGIEKDKLSKIFDPFFTTKPVGQGTGLGLSISHNIIVDKHNGRIEVNSEEGLGTCFNIYLPILSRSL